MNSFVRMQYGICCILPPEKIAFIAYNIGVYESVQKFGRLIVTVIEVRNIMNQLKAVGVSIP
jgi:hypothetical protein